MNPDQLLLFTAVALIAILIYHLIKNTTIEYEIKSLIDLDFYKLTMAQFILKYFPDVEIKLAFKNRTSKVKLGQTALVRNIKRQCHYVTFLRNTDESIRYLSTLKGKSGKLYFEKFFLNWFRTVRLPMPKIWTENEELHIEVTGNWAIVTLWETLLMSIVQGEYTKALMKQRGISEAKTFNEGMKRLMAKIEILLANPGVKIIHFGTRRRANLKWDTLVHKTLLKFLPVTQFIGTSNVQLAMELGLTPVGTFAHELFMTIAAINSASPNALRISQLTIISLWEQMYGPDLLTALSDTFGTYAFFSDFKAFAPHWTGVRHDSGDPFVFGRKTIAYYKKLGIDPKTKTLVYSDGLDLETILALQAEFGNQINLVYGWGTNLSNDIGFENISIVAKPAWARTTIGILNEESFDETAPWVTRDGNGHLWFICCKLTDNLKKAMTGAKDEITRQSIIAYYADVFEYSQSDIVDEQPIR